MGHCRGNAAGRGASTFRGVVLDRAELQRGPVVARNDREPWTAPRRGSDGAAGRAGHRYRLSVFLQHGRRADLQRAWPARRPRWPSPGIGCAVNDVIELDVVGSNLIALRNGTVDLSVSDSSIASGAPGIAIGQHRHADQRLAGELDRGQPGGGQRDHLDFQPAEHLGEAADVRQPHHFGFARDAEQDAHLQHRPRRSERKRADHREHPASGLAVLYRRRGDRGAGDRPGGCRRVDDAAGLPSQWIDDGDHSHADSRERHRNHRPCGVRECRRHRDHHRGEQRDVLLRSPTTALTAGDFIETIGGAADGTTKRMSISMTFTPN